MPITIKSTKVQTLGADHAIEHLALDIRKVNGQDMCNIVQWITFYIRNYTKLHPRILVCLQMP